MKSCVSVQCDSTHVVLKEDALVQVQNGTNLPPPKAAWRPRCSCTVEAQVLQMVARSKEGESENRARA